MKFIIFTASRQEIARKLILLFFIFMLTAQTTAPAAAEVTEWILSPSDPVVGDTIIIRGDADPNEKTDVLISFEREVEVSGGSYEYLLNDVVIPRGFDNALMPDNTFKVEARRAEDLKVRVHVLLAWWKTLNPQSTGEVIEVSYSGVPAGKYRIMIDGKATGSSVDLKIIARQKIKADSEGKLSYIYDTKSIPKGNFEVILGGVTKEITLRTKDAEPEEETQESATSPGTSTPSAFEANTPAENESNIEAKVPSPLKEETIRNENLFKDKMNSESLPEDEGADTVGAEGNEDKKENLYCMIGGIAAGLIVLFSYSRIKKT